MHFTLSPDPNFLNTVQPVVKKALENCEKVLPALSHFDVITNYTDDPFTVERLGGAVGFTGGGDGISLFINTDVAEWEHNVYRTVYHEHNHVSWFQEHGVRHDVLTVKDHIVVEGLALCFEEYMSGVPAEYTQAISREQAREVLEKLKPHFDEPKDDWNLKAWVGDNEEFPLWAGYTLSYMVIRNKIDELNYTWPELMQMNTEAFVHDDITLSV